MEMGTCDTSRYEHAEAAANQLDVHGRVLGLDPLPYPPKMGRLKPQTGQSLLVICSFGVSNRLQGAKHGEASTGQHVTHSFKAKSEGP